MSEQNTYQSQLNEKKERLSLLLQPYYQQAIDVFSSPEQHYRMRAEFRVWHDGDDLYHIMFDQQTKAKYRVDYFPPAALPIYNIMPVLIEKLQARPILRHKLFQIDYLSGLSGQLLISLLYHKTLDAQWHTEITQLKNELAIYNVQFIGRAKKQKCLVDQDYILEQLPIFGREFTFKHVENSFTQPNATVNCHMIEWAAAQAGNLQSDLLELYCGAGNFSIPLAQHFRRVLATEISKTSVAAAQYNIAVNNINNCQILRMSSEEFVQACQGERTFRRLADIDLASYDIETVLVDPPRAGCDLATIKMISAYTNIIYISCNPDTLCENLQELNKTHQITRAALFDQFPYTHHMEVGVYLQRR